MWAMRFTPYHSKVPSPTIPTQRKKEEEGRTVDDEMGASSLGKLKSIDPARETGFILSSLFLFLMTITIPQFTTASFFKTYITCKFVFKRNDNDCRFL